MPRAGNGIPEGYGREGPVVEGHHRDGEIGMRQERINSTKARVEGQKKPTAKRWVFLDQD